MVNWCKEEFEKYWNRRVKYRHPEDKKKKIFARKMFYAGWDHGQFELYKELRENQNDKKGVIKNERRRIK